MSSPAMIRSFPLLLALFSAGSAPAQEASPASKTIEAPKMQVGDWWIRKNPAGGWLRKTVIKVSEDGSFETVSGREKAKEVFDKEYNQTEGYSLNLRSIWYSPPYCHLSFPLFAGKFWECTVGVRFAAGGWYETRVKGSAIDQEEIVLPGKDGERKLSAMRIEYERVSVGSVEKGVCWYSPEAKGFVRCDGPNQGETFSVSEFGTLPTDTPSAK